MSESDMEDAIMAAMKTKVFNIFVSFGFSIKDSHKLANSVDGADRLKTFFAYIPEIKELSQRYDIRNIQLRTHDDSESIFLAFDNALDTLLEEYPVSKFDMPPMSDIFS
jgi:hypothetical protein